MLKRILLVYYFLHKAVELSYRDEMSKRALNCYDAPDLCDSRRFLFDKGSDVVNSDRRDTCQRLALVAGMRQIMRVHISLMLDVIYRKYALPR